VQYVVCKALVTLQTKKKKYDPVHNETTVTNIRQHTITKLDIYREHITNLGNSVNKVHSVFVDGY